MEVDSTSFEEVIRIPCVKSMEKGMIPKRAITIGYNGPTKRNVTPEGMLKDIKLDLCQKIQREESLGLKRLGRTIVLSKVKEWEI